MRTKLQKSVRLCFSIFLWFTLAHCGPPPNPDGSVVGDATDIASENPGSDTNAPSWESGASLDVRSTCATGVVFRWPEARDNVGVANYRVYRDDQPASEVPAETRMFRIDGLTPGVRVRLRVEARDAAGNVSNAALSTEITTATPDFSQQANAWNAATTGPVATQARFLFENECPVQAGVERTAIPNSSIAVVRGRVLDAAGMPLEAVRVQVLRRPEFGSTWTRTDGTFAMAVRGGEQLVFSFQKPALFSAQREAVVRRHEFIVLEDVALIARDSQSSAINLQAGGMQVARSSMVRDASGERRATMLFAPGMQVTAEMPGGMQVPMQNLHVRATEFTAGERGQAQMPATLPATSAYTYAAAFEVDEAVAMGAQTVRFNPPLPTYVENFLRMPVGSIVPVGYYEEQQGAWRASRNGRVVAITSVDGGIAQLDVSGDGMADEGEALTRLGITDAERRELARLYTAGQQLWRVPLPHFSIADFNWPFGPPRNARKGPTIERLLFCECNSILSGSVIGCESQTLGERLPVAGSGMVLAYDTSRIREYRTPYEMEIPVSGAEPLPEGLLGIDVVLEVAGQRIQERLTPRPNLRHVFRWDGKDAFGREVQGAQPATVRVGYVYRTEYQTTPREQEEAFGQVLGQGVSEQDLQIVRVPGRSEIILWQQWQGSIGTMDARAQRMGGWTLSGHHQYDVVSRTLHFGDGTQRSTRSIPNVLTVYAGGGSGQGEGLPATSARFVNPISMAMSPDGSLYVWDIGDLDLRRVNPDGTIVHFGGNGGAGAPTEGPIRDSALLPGDMTVGPDGTLYWADGISIWRVGTDGRQTRIAGNRQEGNGPDGPNAREIAITANSIAVGNDGTVYFTSSQLLRAVTPNGRITTIAGGTGGDPTIDDVPARQARFGYLGPVVVDRENNLYVADTGQLRIRRIGNDGIIRNHAGARGSARPHQDGQIATETPLPGFGSDFGIGMVVNAKNEVVFADSNGLVRRVGNDGRLYAVAGGGTNRAVDRAPALGTDLGNVAVMEVGPDDSLFFLVVGPQLVRRLGPAMAGFSSQEIAIPSSDGSVIDVFDGTGKHLRVLHALMGTVLARFEYDDRGLLSRVVDADNNAITVEREPATRNAQAIVGPYGHRTQLEMNSRGLLERLTDPANASWTLRYQANTGLLSGMTDARGQMHSYSYDASGRLVEDQSPGGSRTRLEVLGENADGRGVRSSSALGRTREYRFETHESLVERRAVTSTAGLTLRNERNEQGIHTSLSSDGTRTRSEQGPDPRFGMLVPVVTRSEVRTPSGQTLATQQQRTATFRDSDRTLTSLTDEVQVGDGERWSVRYDAMTRTVTRRTPEGRMSIATLDERGRVVREEVTGLEPVSYQYDSRGRLVSTQQGTRRSMVSYDERGRMASVTDPLGRVGRFSYDAVDRVTTQTFPDGRSVQMTWDPHGNPLSVTPPGRPAHNFRYNDAGQLASYEPPTLRSGPTPESYNYDLDRAITRTNRADSSRIERTYDAAGRLESVMTPEGAIRVSYDGRTGHVRSVQAPGGVAQEFVRDGSLLNEERWSGTVRGSVRRQYDGQWRVRSLQVSGGTSIEYGYDRDSLLTRAGALAISRNPVNGLVTTTSAGSMTTAHSYNSFGEPTEEVTRFDGTEVYANAYVRDSIGRITERTERVNGVSTTFAYSYDGAGRLFEVRENGVLSAHYEYDGNGNRMLRRTSAGDEVGAYDDQDRVLSYGGETFTHTANGEWLTRTSGTGQTTRYAYDSRGNLVRVELPDGHVIEYVVDGANRRVGRKLDGVLTHQWLWQGQLRPAAELDGAGNLVSVFVYGLHVNVPELILRGGRVYRVVTDQLGSVRMVVDTQSGSVVQRMRYDEWGRVLEDTNPGWQPFGFAGGLWETRTGLVRFGARDYEPGVGRWNSKEPLGFSAESNFYAYAGSNPVSLSDFTGLYAQYVGGAIVGGVWGGTVAYLRGASVPQIALATAGGAVVGTLAGGALPLTAARILGGTLSAVYTGFASLVGVARLQQYWDDSGFYQTYGRGSEEMQRGLPHNRAFICRAPMQNLPNGFGHQHYWVVTSSGARGGGSSESFDQHMSVPASCSFVAVSSGQCVLQSMSSAGHYWVPALNDCRSQAMDSVASCAP